MRCILANVYVWLLGKFLSPNICIQVHSFLVLRLQNYCKLSMPIYEIFFRLLSFSKKTQIRWLVLPTGSCFCVFFIQKNFLFLPGVARKTSLFFMTWLSASTQDLCFPTLSVEDIHDVVRQDVDTFVEVIEEHIVVECGAQRRR